MDVRVQILMCYVKGINYMVLAEVGYELHSSEVCVHRDAHHLCDALTTQHKFGETWYLLLIEVLAHLPLHTLSEVKLPLL